MTAICNLKKDDIIVDGDYAPIEWTLYEDDELYDFTGVTLIEFGIKNDVKSSTMVVYLTSVTNPTQIQYDAPDPGAGMIRVKLLSSDTDGLAVYGSMQYGIKITKSGLEQHSVIGYFPGLLNKRVE